MTISGATGEVGIVWGITNGCLVACLLICFPVAYLELFNKKYDYISYARMSTNFLHVL